MVVLKPAKPMIFIMAISSSDLPAKSASESAGIGAILSVFLALLLDPLSLDLLLSSLDRSPLDLLLSLLFSLESSLSLLLLFSLPLDLDLDLDLPPRRLGLLLLLLLRPIWKDRLRD